MCTTKTPSSQRTTQRQSSKVQTLTASSDICLQELASALDNHADVFFHFCLIVCTLLNFFVLFFIADELCCNYMILNPIMFELYNLNVIPTINVTTGTHNYNAQTLFFMRMCKTYVYIMRYNLKDLQSCQYS